MQTPPIPENEAERLQTLRSFDILDTVPEERFDRLTRLAKRLFDVPIALVSLIDSDRQWFKSNVGIEEARETPREISFCGHAILGDDVFEISDASKDERFFDNPLVKENPNIRFYAGYPLTVSNNKLGTLCLIDREPRHLDDDDKALLQDLAKMVELEIAAMQMATMDELTMLSNRRGFETLAGHALHMCKRLQKPACMLFFDLNDFKEINDKYGHAEGDLALKTFSSSLMNAFRNSDVVARLGGDEFVVLLTNTKLEDANKVLERLQGMIDDHNLLAQNPYDLTYSVGMVNFDSNKHDSVADLIQDADAHMYLDKKSIKALK